MERHVSIFKILKITQRIIEFYRYFIVLNHPQDVRLKYITTVIAQAIVYSFNNDVPSIMASNFGRHYIQHQTRTSPLKSCCIVCCTFCIACVRYIRCHAARYKTILNIVRDTILSNAWNNSSCTRIKNPGLCVILRDPRIWAIPYKHHWNMCISIKHI